MAELPEFIETARYTGPGVEWDEVVGLDHARREVAAVLAMLQRPDVARAIGAELTPLLFIGPAGTGKTMLTKGDRATARPSPLCLGASALGAQDQAALRAPAHDALRHLHRLSYSSKTPNIARAMK
jgi:AAA+ superfamily predicted ATPase